MVIALFLMDNKDKKFCYFKMTFLIADISMDITFNMFFFLHNIQINFIYWEFRYRSYIIENGLPTTKWVKLIRKKEFAAISLDLENQIFIIHIAFIINLDLHRLFKKAQITLLKVDKTFITVPSKYTNFTNLFSPVLIIELFKHIGINTHIIKLIDNKQPLYSPIYSL